MAAYLHEYPQLMKEWHKEKNTVDPNTLRHRSSKKVWWRCAQGHEWEATTSNRAKGQGCPYCSGRRICKENCLATTHPHLVKEWNWERNTLTPDQVSRGSEKKVCWKCISGHEWRAIIFNRSRGHGCPYCTRQKVWRGAEDLYQDAVNDPHGKPKETKPGFAITHPWLMLEWDETKNIELDPATLSPGTKKEAWWICHKGHQWRAQIRSRVRGNGCPYCANRAIALENSILTTHPEIMGQWNYEKNYLIEPSTLSYGTQQPVWWRCEKGHEWRAAVANRIKGNGCPFCSNRAVTLENSIVTTHPFLMGEWHPIKNSDVDPTTISYGSHGLFWWQCKKGHQWQARVYGRSKGEGCPRCRKSRQTSFPEQALFYYINQVLPAKHRYSFQGKEMDIYIPSLQVGIEYDGAYYHDDTVLHREQKKDAYLKGQGIKIIRIKEGDQDYIDVEKMIIWTIPTKNYLYLEHVWTNLLHMIKALTGKEMGRRICCDIRKDRKTILNQYRD